MKSKFLLLIGLIFYINVCAQDLPKVIHPSPEASALFRFLDIPVSHSTGVPEISVPIYEVKCGSLSVPISISYHAGGMKVNDKTGPIGLGWSLYAGGMMSRTVYGKPDEYFSFPDSLKMGWQITNKIDYDYLASLYYDPFDGGTYDSQFDVFSYYFGSNSGKFIMSPDRDSVYLMPLKPFKVITAQNTFPSTIVDDKGDTYYFGTNESWQNGFTQNVVTGALLTSIISANKKDTIYFTYTNKNISKSHPVELFTFPDDNSTPDPSVTQNTYFSTTSTNTDNYLCRRLTEIRSRSGKVKFNLVNNSDRISNIQIIDNNNVTLKTFHLQTSSIGNELKLDEIIQTGSNDQISERYAFEYYPLYGGSGFGDYFGFVTNSNQSHGVPYYYNVQYSVPLVNVSINTYPCVGSGANRYDGTGSTSGVLKKITYPTGGSAEFTYEANKAVINEFNPQTIYECAGIRVKQIKTIDNNGNISYKTYKYGKNEIGYGTKSYLNIQAEDMSYEKRYFPYIDDFYHNNSFLIENMHTSYRKRFYTSDFLPEIEEVANEPVFYSDVTEYNGTPDVNVGKTVYKYNGENNSLVSHLNSPAYGEIDPPYCYLTLWNYAIDPMLMRPHIYMYNYFKPVYLASKEVFKNAGNNVYIPVSASSSFHNYIQTNSFRGLHISKYLEINDNIGTKYESESLGAKTIGLPVFQWGDYWINIGKDELASTNEITYNDNGNIWSTTSYVYNNNLLVSEIHTSTSTSGEVITTNTYPFDYPSNSIYQDMTSNNMINYVVEQSKYKNNTSTFLNSTINNYSKWYDDFFAPITIDTRTNTPGNNPIPRIRFHDYDNQVNVKSVSKEAGPKVNYIYSYKGEYPIAKIENADYSTVESVLGGLAAVENFMKTAYPTDNAVNTFLAPLRSNLTNAMVTTFTYRPLVGINSSTDPKGMTTYYEYDTFQRLKSIKDQNGNIIKSYEYHYKQ